MNQRRLLLRRGPRLFDLDDLFDAFVLRFLDTLRFDLRELFCELLFELAVRLVDRLDFRTIRIFTFRIDFLPLWLPLREVLLVPAARVRRLLVPPFLLDLRLRLPPFRFRPFPLRPFLPPLFPLPLRLLLNRRPPLLDRLVVLLPDLRVRRTDVLVTRVLLIDFREDEDLAGGDTFLCESLVL